MFFIIFFCFIGICCAYLSRVHVKKLTSLKDQLDEKNKQARIEEIKSLLKCDWKKLVINLTLPEVINNNRLVRELEELTGQKKTASYGLSFESLEDCHIALAERFKVDIAETSRRGYLALNLTKGHLDRKYKSDSH